jgi:DNA-binding transcriptional LysR family regulator
MEQVALRDLTYFLAVERQGSFGRAATELMVSQPAVSERIRHLERTVGAPLFERSTRGAALTVAGAALLPYARRCSDLASEALDVARSAAGSPPLVVAVHSTFAQRTVPLVLSAIGTTPRRLSIRDAHSEQVPALVADGVADLGFALPASAARGLVRVPLPPDDVVCVAGADHPLRRLRRPSIGDLRDSLVAVNAWGEGHTAFLDKLTSTGLEDWRVRYCGDAATALVLARDHSHVAFVAESSTTGFAGVEKMPLRGLTRWRVRLDLLCRRADRETPILSAVVDALREPRPEPRLSVPRR